MSSSEMAPGASETVSRSASPSTGATALANSVSQTSSVLKVNINLNKREGEPVKQHSPLATRPTPRNLIKQHPLLSLQLRPILQQQHLQHLQLQQQQQQRYAKIQPAIKPRPIAVLPKPLSAIKSKFDPTVPTTSQIKSSLHNNTPLNINTSKKWILPPRPRPGRKPTTSGTSHQAKPRLSTEHSVTSSTPSSAHVVTQSNAHTQAHPAATPVSNSHQHNAHSNGHPHSNSQSSGLNGSSLSSSLQLSTAVHNLQTGHASSFHTPKKKSMSSPPPPLKMTKKQATKMTAASTTKHATSGQIPHSTPASQQAKSVPPLLAPPLSLQQQHTHKKVASSSGMSQEKKLLAKKKLKPLTKESDNETIINQLKQQYPPKQQLLAPKTQSATENQKNRNALLSSGSSLSDTPVSSGVTTPNTTRISNSPIPIQSKNSQPLATIRKISPAPGPVHSVGTLGGITPTHTASEPKRTLLDLKGIYLNKLKEQELIRNYIDVINNQIKELNFVKNGVITFAALDGNSNNPVTGDTSIVSENISSSNTSTVDGEGPSISPKTSNAAGSKTTRKPVSCEQLELINNLNDLNKFLAYFLKSSSIIHSATKKYVNGNKSSTNTAQDKSDAKAEHKRQLDALDQQIRYYLELRARFQVDLKVSVEDKKGSDVTNMNAPLSPGDPDANRKLKMKKFGNYPAENETSGVILIVEDQVVGDIDSTILNALVKELSFPFGEQDMAGNDNGIQHDGKNVIRNDVVGNLLPPGGINSLLSPSSFTPNLYKSMSLQDDELIDFLNSESEKTDSNATIKPSSKSGQGVKLESTKKGKSRSPKLEQLTSPLLVQYERQLSDGIGSEVFGDDSDTPSVAIKIESELDHIMNLDKLMLHDDIPGSLTKSKIESVLVDDLKTAHDSESEEIKMHSLLMDRDTNDIGGFFGLRGFGSSTTMGISGGNGSKNKCGFCGNDSPCFCLEGDIM